MGVRRLAESIAIALAAVALLVMVVIEIARAPGTWVIFNGLMQAWELR